MKKCIFLIFSILLIITSCDNNNAAVHFNQIKEYETAGARLVEPVIVAEKDFCLNYDINLNTLINNKSYKVQYRLDYALDQETVQADFSSLINGTVRIIEDEKVILVFYVSTDYPIVQYAFDSDKIVTSSIENVDVQLFDLSKDSSSLLYGTCKLGDYYITFSTRHLKQMDMVTILTDFICDNTVEKK